MSETYDVVIVDAGWSGLAAAKAYGQLHPEGNFTVLEANESCGGTWSKNRLYPGLKSNNMVGTYEHPDFPMSREKYGLGPLDHIPAAALHDYLTEFTKHFGFFDRIQFHTRVDLVQPSANGWRLSVTTPGGSRSIEATKLILATGLTSTPNMPSYRNEETFGAPFFHAKDFCKEAENIKGTKKAVVVGGAKSAYDVAYALVQDGAEVDLVIRPDGNGPVWISPSLVTPFKKRMDQLLNIRWMTWFSPCPWGSADGFPRIRRFLHGTAVGRFIVNTFWSVLQGDVLSANNYNSHPELQKLKPWHSAFWIGSGLSILNYDTDLWELLKSGKMRVHVENIDHLEPQKVVLDSGKVLDAEVLICSTGWKKESSIKFGDMGNRQLGLPFDQVEQLKMANGADKKVLTMFPRLADQPDLKAPLKPGHPLRYYRFMVPSTMIESRNLAFTGMISSVSTAVCATMQGHWIVAYFDGKLDHLPSSQEEVTDEIMLHTQWGRWRHPIGYGPYLPDFVFDALPYANLLMRDLGLSVRRKGSTWAELTSPYTPADFWGLIEEWELKQRDRAGSNSGSSKLKST